MNRQALIDELRRGPISGEVETTHRLMLLAADLLEGTIDPIADVEAFHEKFGQLYRGRPRALTGEAREFREEFLEEELREYKDATVRLAYFIDMLQNTRPVGGEALVSLQYSQSHKAMAERRIPEMLEKALDSLVDLVYVAIGNAVWHGFNFREGWRRVHTANMQKERAKTALDSKRGTALDIVKPPGWVAPSHLDLVVDHAHKEEP